MDLNFNEIRDLSKDAFKDLVKKHVRATAFEELKETQKTHSKSKKIEYNEMKMQEYLTANSGMTKQEKAFAFSARAQMLDVKHNFKFGKLNLNCSLSCDTAEDQDHSLRCPVLREKDEKEMINYTNIYTQDHIKVTQITQILMRKFELFTKLKATVHRQTQPSAAATSSNDNVNIDVINVA